METGKVEFAPDYKSEKPLRKFPVGSDGLTDGMRGHLQREAERARLERDVIEAAVEEYKFEHAADHGSNTITRTEALVKMQKAMKAKREAVKALLEFESQHSIQK